MRGREPDTHGRLLARMGAGLAIFLLGAALALAFLPEWRTGDPPDLRLYQERYARLVREAGFEPAPGEPRAVLVTARGLLASAYAALGEGGAAWLARSRTAVDVQVSHGVHRPGSSGKESLKVYFSLDGQPVRVEWEDPASPLFRPVDRADFLRLGLSLARLVTAPGESLGPPQEHQIAGQVSAVQVDLGGSDPPQRLEVSVALRIGRLRPVSKLAVVVRVIGWLRKYVQGVVLPTMPRNSPSIGSSPGRSRVSAPWRRSVPKKNRPSVARV